MKRKLLLVFLTLLLCCISMVVYASGIDSHVNVDGDIVTITGKINGVNKPKIVTLLVGDADNIVHIDETSSDSSGNFTFQFAMGDSIEEGEYPYTIGSSAKVGNSYGIVDYRGKTVKAINHFMTADLDVSLSGYIPTISGTVSCKGGKTINIIATNITDNKVIANDILTSNDGNYEILYSLPSLISLKNYLVEVVVYDGLNEQVAISVEIDSSIVLVNIDGSIDIDDRTYIDAHVKSVNSDLIDKSTTVSSDRTFSITIPNLVANAKVGLKANGYERVNLSENDDVPEIIVDARGDTSSVVVTGKLEPAYCIDMMAELLNSDMEVIASGSFKTDMDGKYVYSFDLENTLSAGLYSVKVYITDNVFESDDVFIVQPLSKKEIKKSDNPQLFGALKKARPSLDSDKDNTITINELENIVGTLDISSSSIESIDGLQSCTGITELYANNNKITNLDVIYNLDNLEKLVADNNNICEINILPENLLFLDVSYNKLSKLDCLDDTKNLRFLFADNNYMPDLSFVKKLYNLEYLSASYNLIEDISDIQNCTKIRYLNLSSNSLTDISYLNNLNLMMDVFLDYNQIDYLDGLPDLWYRNLHVKYNYISKQDISGYNAINKSY